MTVIVGIISSSITVDTGECEGEANDHRQDGKERDGYEDAARNDVLLLPMPVDLLAHSLEVVYVRLPCV